MGNDDSYAGSVLDGIPWIEEALKQVPELVACLRSLEHGNHLIEMTEPRVLPIVELARQEWENSPYQMWFDLWELFEKAWKEEPVDMALIDRIYGFYEWCTLQPEGSTASDDLGTVCVVCFLEHIPQLPPAVDDMPNRFTKDDVRKMRQVFSYLVGEEGYRKILDAFEKPRPWKPKRRM